MRRAWLTVLLLPMTALAADEILDLSRVRQVNLDRAADMPNFVADETATYFTAEPHTDPSRWRYMMTPESEVSVKGTQITRQHMRRNGKPLAKPVAVVIGGFGIELPSLFKPECPTQIGFERREEGNSWYRFSSPANACFERLGPDSRHMYNAARTGRILVDDQSGDLIRFEAEANGFPKGFPFVQRDEVETWGRVSIGDASHLLPVSAEFIWRYASALPFRLVIEYKNHRRFEASTNVTFH
jgi:hypothetical protein